MACKYQVTTYKATKYKVDKDGNFTGDVTSMWDSGNKRKALIQLVKEFNVDLNASYAYGDTAGDLSMLKIVGNPVAVNPIKKLLREINQDEQLMSKTTVIVERKDLIYKLTPTVKVLDI